MTPAERACRIDDAEFRLECAAARARAFSYSKACRDREAEQYRTWLHNGPDRAPTTPRTPISPAPRTYVRPACTYEFRGEQKTLKEIAEATGINAKTLSDRLAKGWTIERALTEPVRGGRGPSARKIEFRGVMKTAQEIAELIGRSKQWVHRHSDGMKFVEPDKRAYSDPGTHEHWPTYFYAGVTDTLSGWARRTGIPRMTIKARLFRGWPIERALTEQSRIRRPKEPECSP